jgi:DNA-binding CsgD family transcriptional regulator
MPIPNSGDDLIAAIYDVIKVVNRIVEATKSMSGGLLMEETNAARPVELAEWQLLETLAPHLQRAAAIHDLLGRVRAVTNSLGEAVAAAGFAVLLVTGDCRVVFANVKAEDLLRLQTGLRDERGRLAAATPALTARLHALARQGSRPRGGEGHAGGTLELSRGENCPPLVAHVIPLDRNRTVASLDLDLDRPAAALFVIDPAANLDATAQRFAVQFGLTGAETRILVELVRGNGLLSAAAQLKITEATARTHAKRILAKTGTCRQTELIRRFFETTLLGLPDINRHHPFR